MLKKSKQLILGIVIGFVLASSVAFGADVISNAYFNSDLKLAINGQEVKDIRIVTVELEDEQYGRNYYSIADLIKALNDYGGISAKVDFDAETKTTVIEVEKEVVMVTPTPVPETPVLNRLIEQVESEKEKDLQLPEKNESSSNPIVKKYTEDGLEILEVDGKKYVNSKEVEKVLCEYFEGSVHVFPNENDDYLYIVDMRITGIGFSDITKFPEKKPVPKELTELQIPWYDPIDEGQYYIEYDYYINNILSQLK